MPAAFPNTGGRSIRFSAVRDLIKIRKLQPVIHVYGHSHVNQVIEIDGMRYMNAFAALKRALRARNWFAFLMLKLCQAFGRRKSS